MLRELAQQYKALYAPRRRLFSSYLCHHFVKYVAPSILFFVMFSFAVFVFATESAAAAPTPQGFASPYSMSEQQQGNNTSGNGHEANNVQPQGFSAKNEKRASPQGFGIESTTSPNTVKGVLNHAHSNDYVVLEGVFVAEEDGDKITYKFADASGDTIEVDISSSNNATAPQPNTKYYLWGTVNRDWFSTTINAIEYTPMG